jgi:hypothetical protein
MSNKDVEMNFNVRSIGMGSEYKEMTVDAIKTGTLDKKEAIQLAKQMLSAVEDLLQGCDVKADRDALTNFEGD